MPLNSARGATFSSQPVGRCDGACEPNALADRALHRTLAASPPMGLASAGDDSDCCECCCPSETHAVTHEDLPHVKGPPPQYKKKPKRPTPPYVRKPVTVTRSNKKVATGPTEAAKEQARKVKQENDIEVVFNKSNTLRDLFDKLKKDGWSIETGPLDKEDEQEPAHVDRKNKVIYVPGNMASGDIKTLMVLLAELFALALYEKAVYRSSDDPQFAVLGSSTTTSAEAYERYNMVREMKAKGEAMLVAMEVRDDYRFHNPPTSNDIGLLVAKDHYGSYEDIYARMNHGEITRDEARYLIGLYYFDNEYQPKSDAQDPNRYSGATDYPWDGRIQHPRAQGLSFADIWFNAYSREHSRLDTRETTVRHGPKGTDLTGYFSQEPWQRTIHVSRLDPPTHPADWGGPGPPLKAEDKDYVFIPERNPKPQGTNHKAKNVMNSTVRKVLPVWTTDTGP